MEAKRLLLSPSKKALTAKMAKTVSRGRLAFLLWALISTLTERLFLSFRTGRRRLQVRFLRLRWIFRRIAETVLSSVETEFLCQKLTLLTLWRKKQPRV